MSQGLLSEMAVVGNAAMAGRTALEWDKDDVDALKLLKVDILALGTLSCPQRGLPGTASKLRLSCSNSSGNAVYR
jgi:error-prone DNA polymerase